MFTVSLVSSSASSQVKSSQVVGGYCGDFVQNFCSFIKI